MGGTHARNFYVWWIDRLWKGRNEDQQQQKKFPIKLHHLESGKINDDDKLYTSGGALLHDNWDMH